MTDVRHSELRKARQELVDPFQGLDSYSSERISADVEKRIKKLQSRSWSIAEWDRLTVREKDKLQQLKEVLNEILEAFRRIETPRYTAAQYLETTWNYVKTRDDIAFQEELVRKLPEKPKKLRVSHIPATRKNQIKPDPNNDQETVYASTSPVTEITALPPEPVKEKGPTVEPITKRNDPRIVIEQLVAGYVQLIDDTKDPIVYFKDLHSRLPEYSDSLINRYFRRRGLQLRLGEELEKKKNLAKSPRTKQLWVDATTELTRMVLEFNEGKGFRRRPYDDNRHADPDSNQDD